MLLLFMEKEVHKPRCTPGASSIFRLLSIWFGAGKAMPFGRRRAEPCGNEAACPRSPAEALLAQGPRAKAALAQPVPRPAAEGSTAPGGHRNQPRIFPPLPVLGTACQKAQGALWQGHGWGAQGCLCWEHPGETPGFLTGSRGERLSTRQGDFCMGTLYNRACMSLSFLSWKALKFLADSFFHKPALPIVKIVTVVPWFFFFFFLVKVSIFRICWAKTKLMFFIRELRFVLKHGTAGTGLSEGHQKPHSQRQVPTSKIQVLVHLARKLLHS